MPFNLLIVIFNEGRRGNAATNSVIIFYNYVTSDLMECLVWKENHLMAQDLDFSVQGNGWQNVASNTWLSVLMQKNFDWYMSQRPKYVFTKRSCHSNWIYHDVKKFVATERIPLFLLGISLINDIHDWFLIKLVISIMLYIIEYFPTGLLTEKWCYT